ncbi:MAG: hypothetical protein JWN14_262 [Chthonomonadales bacterium]|nr:hypothetical protein [Chthonomonadales bacterium]
MKKRGPRILFFLVLLCIGGSALLLVKTSEPLLLKRATKVAKTSSWTTPPYIYSWIGSLDRKAALRVAFYDSIRSPVHLYRWINDHEVLFFREKSPQSRSAPGWNFYKIDTLTGQETSLTALSRLAQNSFDSSSRFAISPDGKRFFWTGKGITVTTLDGEQSFQLGPEATSHIFEINWTEDSNHLITYSTQSEGHQTAQRTLYDIQARKATQHLAVNLDSTSDIAARDKRLLIFVWKEHADVHVPEALEIDEREIGNTTLPPHKYTVLLPHNLKCGKALFSPQGDRIAWQFIEMEGTVPPVLAWLHRLVPAFHPPPPKPKVSLWVSRLDGSQMQELGYVLVPALPPGSAVGWSMLFDHLSWLPDGKHLSFRHEDALYTVPAD